MGAILIFEGGLTMKRIFFALLLLLMAALVQARNYAPARIMIEGIPVPCSASKPYQKCGVALNYGAVYRIAVWGGEPNAEYAWTLPDGTKRAGTEFEMTRQRPGMLTLWTRDGQVAGVSVHVYSPRTK
jgi:hypothetical protein